MKRKGKRILLSERLNDLASVFVGDGKDLNAYFVTDKGDVMMVTYDGDAAHAYWRQLAARLPLRESALEDRLTGVLASVEPRDDNDPTLIVTDEYRS